MASSSVKRALTDTLIYAGFFIISGAGWSLVWSLTSRPPVPLQNWLGVTIAALLIGAIIVIPLARWRPTWLLAVSLIGIIAPIAILGRDNPLWPTASFSGVGGGMLAGILARRWITRNVPLVAVSRVCWDDGEHVEHIDNPTQDQIMTRLDALNATNHTMVSIHNQHGRFDACCPQPDHYWAFQTENNGKHQHLYQLTPGLPNTNSETPARIGGWDFHYPNNLTITHTDLTTAAQAFTNNQPRPNTLTWNTDQPHHEILIPPPLNQLD